MAKLVFQMVRLYVTTPTMYRVIGKTGVDWQSFDPKQFEGDYEPRVKLTATLDEEKTKKMRDLKELYTSMLGNPLVDQHQLTRLIIQKAFDLEQDEVDKLMVDPSQVAQSNQKDKGQTPEEIALAGIAKAYGKGERPDIEAQIEELAGLHPSVTHQGNIQTVASQQVLDQAQHGSSLADMALSSQQPQQQPATNQNQPSPVGTPGA